MPTDPVTDPRELRVPWVRRAGVIGLLFFFGVVGLLGMVDMLTIGHPDCASLGMALLFGLLAGPCTYGALANLLDHTRLRFDGQTLDICHRPFPVAHDRIDLSAYDSAEAAANDHTSLRRHSRQLVHDRFWDILLRSSLLGDVWVGHRFEDPDAAAAVAAQIETWRQEAAGRPRAGGSASA